MAIIQETGNTCGKQERKQQRKYCEYSDYNACEHTNCNKYCCDFGKTISLQD
jgi:hypothetical protein